MASLQQHSHNCMEFPKDGNTSVETRQGKVTWHNALFCTKTPKPREGSRNLSSSRFLHPWFHVGFSELQSHFSLRRKLKIHEGADLKAPVPCHGERKAVTSQSPWVYELCSALA